MRIYYHKYNHTQNHEYQKDLQAFKSKSLLFVVIVTVCLFVCLFYLFVFRCLFYLFLLFVYLVCCLVSLVCLLTKGPTLNFYWILINIYDFRTIANMVTNKGSHLHNIKFKKSTLLCHRQDQTCCYQGQLQYLERWLEIYKKILFVKTSENIAYK